MKPTRRSISKWIIETVTTTSLFALPVDLLYLYYAGGWTEPNQAILLGELVGLHLLPIFAIWRLIRIICMER